MKNIALIILASLSAITLHAQKTTPEAPAVKKESRSTTPAPRTTKRWQERNKKLIDNANTITDQRSLVFIGDSITQNWEKAGKKLWAKHFKKYNALNLGIGGDRTEHVLWRLQNGSFPKALKPKVAVLMIGTNNSGSVKTAQPAPETAAGIILIVNEIHKRSPETQIILNAIFTRGPNSKNPLRKINNEINKIISVLDKRDYVHYIDINEHFMDKDGKLFTDIMPDFLHPREAGYQIWVDGILPKIKEILTTPIKPTKKGTNNN